MKHTYKKLLHRLICCLAGLCFICSCKKFVEIDNPSDQIVTVTVFSDDATATSAIIGLYSNMMEYNTFLTNGGVTLCAGLTADEIYNRNSNPEDDAFHNNAILPQSENVYLLLWSPAYTNIYHANAILEGLEKSNTLSSSVKQQLSGEAKFIRALYYFYLTNFFGDVPLIASTDYRINQAAPKSTKTIIYDQIINDLKDAKKLLAGFNEPGRVRASKWAAAALLARVYLYQQDWINAEAESTLVINSGLFELMTDLDTAFLSDSRETIFQLIPGKAFNATAEGLAFVPGAAASSRPAYLLSEHLSNAFETGDSRRTYWVNTKTVNSVLYTFAYKYKIRSSPDPTNEYNIVLRLAEQFLIRAEARAMLNNLAGSTADINAVRTRAGLSGVNVNSQNEMLASLLHERQVELFAEWGHRWFDLVRSGTADSVLKTIKAPNWQQTDVLYPIPLSQLKLNPFLTQNPGY